jgi:hypothetical protein
VPGEDQAQHGYSDDGRQFAQRAAGQQQHGEAERIGVHRPLQVGRPRTEVGADGRERDRDHQPVQRERKQRQRRNRKRRPQPWLGIHPVNSARLGSTRSTPRPAAAFTASGVTLPTPYG